MATFKLGDRVLYMQENIEGVIMRYIFEQEEGRFPHIAAYELDFGLILPERALLKIESKANVAEQIDTRTEGGDPEAVRG